MSDDNVIPLFPGTQASGVVPLVPTKRYHWRDAIDNVTGEPRVVFISEAMDPAQHHGSVMELDTARAIADGLYKLIEARESFEHWRLPALHLPSLSGGRITALRSAIQASNNYILGNERLGTSWY